MVVARFGAPHGAELDLARFRRSIGLLALASRQLFGAQRDTRSIDTQIESTGNGKVSVGGLRVLAFGGGDLRPQVFRRSFHLLGVHRHPGQLLP